MPEGEGAGDRDGGVLAGLLAPLRLPERVLQALDSLDEATRELRPMRAELVRAREQTERLGAVLPVAERISDQARPLEHVLPALERLERALLERFDGLQGVLTRLESEESHLNKGLGDVAKAMSGMQETLDAMHDTMIEMKETISGLQDDVERITDRLPEPGEKRGPLETARDVLTGGD